MKTALVELWLSPTQSRNSQIQVAFALCKLKIDARGLLRFLTSTLGTSQDAALRKAAAEALACCNKTDIDVVPALLTSALSDKDERVRQIAEAALAQLKLSQEKAVQICAKQLKESAFAESALRHSGQQAVPVLIEALDTDEPETREKAARTLGFLGELAVAAAPALTLTLEDKNPEVRLAAAKGLWNISKNADAVVPVLVELLEEKTSAAVEASEPRRRFLQTVIEALWRMGPPAIAARPALMEKTKHKNRLISESATSALKKIAPAEPTRAGVRTSGPAK